MQGASGRYGPVTVGVAKGIADLIDFAVDVAEALFACGGLIHLLAYLLGQPYADVHRGQRSPQGCRG
ncbi:MAG: hypothetical protein JO287_05295 [Pseudonocardiales bacterium]|nr:hypothetical protein [Pseudonocardiales bacterium]